MSAPGAPSLARRYAIIGGLLAAAVAIALTTPPAGLTPVAMQAAALCVLCIGLWATAVVPEHVPAMVFFVLAMAGAVAPPEVVFSGFASSAMWLVLGGLVLGVATTRSGLGAWLAGLFLARVGGGYPTMVLATVLGATALAFLVPSSMARMVILTPIVIAVAERLGFGAGSTGRTGLVLASVTTTFLVPTTILPANLPNVVLLGMADTIYGAVPGYWEYLLMHFPLSGAVKGVLLALVICRTFPAEIAAASPAAAATEPPTLGRDGRRLLAVLCVALALWMTDSWHGIAPGWIATAAAIVCLLPGIDLVPPDAFRRDVSLSAIVYTGGVLGVGALVAHAGLGVAVADVVLGRLQLGPDQPGLAFAAFSGLTSLLTFFATNPGAVAIMTPLAEGAARVADLPLMTMLMCIVNGFSVAAFPYQAAPLVIGLALGQVGFAPATRVLLPVALASWLVLWPLTYLWWSALGRMSPVG
ncbi:MAG: anion permease [Ectothiorhodospiraceae bacterium]|nr:anion permease [Chromatiales bacterium]MCP5154205.1 anion permease [Ectothiorhodospiraceae bacterium]